MGGEGMQSKETQGILMQAKNLELWRGERCLFRDLSFSLGKAKVLHVSGPNGCGKTSLLRVLCGLSMPEQGVISWQGQNINRCREDFQQGFAWLGHLNGIKADFSARENLAFSAGLRNGIEEETRDDVLDRVGLAGAADLPCRVLSAGQKRRLALATIMLSSAALWILDEPFTNLDVVGREMISTLLDQHCASGGAAIVAAHQELGVDPACLQRLELENAV